MSGFATLQISEVGVLRQIDLNHRYHDCYRLTKVQGFLCDIEIFSRVPTERWSYKLPSWIDANAGKTKVDVSVSFQIASSTSDRTFTQCLKFDFGKKPYLLQGLNVDIASKEALDTISATREKLKLDSCVWTEGSVEVVATLKTATMNYQNRDLQNRYKLPVRIENVVSAQVVEVDITAKNYQRVMHQLLFAEELFMKKAISR